MTRFEQIKAMNVQEMAKEMNKMDCLSDEICKVFTNCPYMDEEGNISDDCDCIGCIVKWLESEVTENEND